MFKNSPKGLMTGLTAALVLTLIGGTAYASMASSQYLADLFGTTTTPPAASSAPATDDKTSAPIPVVPQTTPVPPASQAESITSLPVFSLYGEIKPDTQQELCDFLDSRLHDTKILAPRALHRYQTDFGLHCPPADDLHGAAPTPAASMSYFLRNATSGVAALMAVNNVYLLFSDQTQTPPSAVDATTIVQQ